MKKVLLKEVVKELGLEVIWGTDFLKKEIIKPMSSRPSVEIYAGYFEYFEKDRIQIIGSKELALFNLLVGEDKKKRLYEIFNFNSPAFVFTKNAVVPKEFVEAAIDKKIPILKSSLSTSALIGKLHAYLSMRLAKRESVTGAMVDVYGVGVLIQGESGIGKSETALELLKRGHLLVADEETKIFQREPGLLMAEAPEVTDKLMDIADVGMINIINLFGIGAYTTQKQLQLVVKLIREENEIEKNSTETFFDTEVPVVTILVKPGRNIASLIEIAALNNRLLQMGQSGDVEFAKRLAESVVKRVK